MDHSDRRPILVALSGSASSTAAIEAGLELARAEDAPIHLLRVDIYPEGDDTWPGESRRLDAGSDPALREAGRRATALGLEARCDRVFGHPPEEIALVAEEIDARLVVVGSTRRAVLANASVPRLLTRICRRPVLVVPREFDRPLGRLLVPTDGSPRARRALAQAVDLAAALGGELVALEVVKTSGANGVEPPAGEIALVEAESEARASGVPHSSELVACDSVYDGIRDAIRRLRPGTVVVSGPGHGRRLSLRRRLYVKLLGLSAVSVLVVPGDAEQLLTASVQPHSAAA
jgi:nucleotide-binding universal stress UspA family protein